jgi:hypothetical protein
MAKGKKTGGRKKGSINKRTKIRAELLNNIAKHGGVTPVEFLLAEMRKPIVGKMTFEQRMRVREYRASCANQAAPYLHARLASVEHRTPPGGMDVNVSGEVALTMDPNDPRLLEAARRIAFVMALGARLAKQQQSVLGGKTEDER